MQICLNSEIDGNRKSLAECMQILQKNEYREADILNYLKQCRYELWIKLMSSEWFSIFLQYLNLKYIAKLDTAFCGSSIRPLWLNLLKNFSPKVEFVNNRLVEKVTDWLAVKNIHPMELSFKYSVAFDSHEALSDVTIFKLTKNSPKLKKLRISKNRSAVYIALIPKKLLSYTSAFCKELECLETDFLNISENGLEILSRTCHHLKHIAFIDASNYTGIDKLLKVNPGLLSLDIRILSVSSPIVSNMLEILGLYCPHLQKCRMVIRETTDDQIEIFTKGCPEIKKLWLNMLPTKICYKLLRCLGSNSPALEELHASGVEEDEADGSNFVLTREQCQSLQCLSNGCFLLKEIWLCNFKFPTSDVNYLVNHSIHLEEVSFIRCSICDDGVIIIKEADKLKYLKLLKVFGNPNIIDESILNLIKGCPSLKVVNINECGKLTDTCLFSIAANCPNLETIGLDFDDVNITVLGLIELLNKCPKLTDITPSDSVPVEIKNELKQRKNSMV